MTDTTPARRYGFATTIAAPLGEAIERTKEVLKEQGFGVLTEIDVRRTLQEKLGAEFRPYVILGACNPRLAHRALSADLGVGLLLPCNVVVYENGDGTSTVEALNPEAVAWIMGEGGEIAAVAEDAKRRLRKAVAALGQRGA